MLKKTSNSAYWMNIVINRGTAPSISDNSLLIYVYIVELLYSRHPWDKYKCPDYRGVLISVVNLYYKVQFGTSVSVLNTGVSSFPSLLNREVSLYTITIVLKQHYIE